MTWTRSTPDTVFFRKTLNLPNAAAMKGSFLWVPALRPCIGWATKLRPKRLRLQRACRSLKTAQQALDTIDITRQEAERIGYPLMMKAAAGGGGRGMRVINKAEDLEQAYTEAQREAAKAFGNDTVFS